MEWSGERRENVGKKTNLFPSSLSQQNLKKTVNRDGRVPGGGDRGYGSWNRPQFYRPTNFWTGGWTDPFGCRWNNGLLIANIVVNSIAIAGYWSGGCCGCGYFNYYGGSNYGAGVCGYCTFWNGYQVRAKFLNFFVCIASLDPTLTTMQAATLE